jgi:hypothetical protein
LGRPSAPRLGPRKLSDEEVVAIRKAYQEHGDADRIMVALELRGRVTRGHVISIGNGNRRGNVGQDPAASADDRGHRGADDEPSAGGRAHLDRGPAAADPDGADRDHRFQPRSYDRIVVTRARQLAAAYAATHPGKLTPLAAIIDALTAEFSKVPKKRTVGGWLRDTRRRGDGADGGTTLTDHHVTPQMGQAGGDAAAPAVADPAPDPSEVNPGPDLGVHSVRRWHPDPLFPHGGIWLRNQPAAYALPHSRWRTELSDLAKDLERAELTQQGQDDRHSRALPRTVAPVAADPHTTPETVGPIRPSDWPGDMTIGPDSAAPPATTPAGLSLNLDPEVARAFAVLKHILGDLDHRDVPGGPRLPRHAHDDAVHRSAPGLADTPTATIAPAPVTAAPAVSARAASPASSDISHRNTTEAASASSNQADSPWPVEQNERGPGDGRGSATISWEHDPELFPYNGMQLDWDGNPDPDTMALDGASNPDPDNMPMDLGGVLGQILLGPGAPVVRLEYVPGLDADVLVLEQAGQPAEFAVLRDPLTWRGSFHQALQDVDVAVAGGDRTTPRIFDPDRADDPDSGQGRAGPNRRQPFVLWNGSRPAGPGRLGTMTGADLRRDESTNPIGKPSAARMPPTEDEVTQIVQELSLIGPRKHLEEALKLRAQLPENEGLTYRQIASRTYREGEHVGDFLLPGGAWDEWWKAEAIRLHTHPDYLMNGADIHGHFKEMLPGQKVPSERIIQVWLAQYRAEHPAPVRNPDIQQAEQQLAEAHQAQSVSTEPPPPEYYWAEHATYGQVLYRYSTNEFSLDGGVTWHPWE